MLKRGWGWLRVIPEVAMSDFEAFYEIAEITSSASPRRESNAELPPTAIESALRTVLAGSLMGQRRAEVFNSRKAFLESGDATFLVSGYNKLPLASPQTNWAIGRKLEFSGNSLANVAHGVFKHAISIGATWFATCLRYLLFTNWIWRNRLFAKHRKNICENLVRELAAPPGIRRMYLQRPHAPRRRTSLRQKTLSLWRDKNIYVGRSTCIYGN